MLPPEETPLQMARRHVSESEDRIERQEALVARLERQGHTEMVGEARELLAAMREFLKVSRAHLQVELGRSQRPRPGT